MIEFEEMGQRSKSSYLSKEKEINLTHPESQQMCRRMIERARDGFYMADVKGWLFYVNHAMVLLLGFERKDEVLGANLAEVLFKDRGKRADFLRKINEAGAVRDFEIELHRNDGLDAVLSMSGNFLENDAGEVIGLDGIVRDVTDRAHLEQALRVEKRKMEQILEFDEVLGTIRQLDELVECAVERVANILEAQKCSVMLLDDAGKALTIVAARGLTAEAIKSSKIEWGQMIAGAVAQDGQALLVRNIEYDAKYRRANRPSYLGRSFMIAPIRLGHQVVGVINVADKRGKHQLGSVARLNYEEAFTETDLRVLTTMAREVSLAHENVKLYAELSSLAVTDPLTHIYNYRQFSKSLDYEIKRCRRSNTPLCMIMIDLDNLKLYNDTFGHLEGDALLRDIARIFKDQLREVDIVCRYAGDEFAIILPDTGIEGARLAAAKIQAALARSAFKSPITLSMGIAVHEAALTPYQLILRADQALYKAKHEGKNRVVIFEKTGDHEKT